MLQQQGYFNNNKYYKKYIIYEIYIGYVYIYIRKLLYTLLTLVIFYYRN